ncbi:DUF2971 domain-containing protein [Solimicrobium silvestre]|uniref:DUF2971 domain-containing protein n=1 Tax=Solimicrobium silvestre TaxID=2099400 RepID=A0A2S9GWM3_9BURK|nr:DUF2971 domain-containing protein [Solimicrobium silvestre]PRC92123.1 hypothetical protein S2091_3258 [Solimicrobium silvestre]
MTNEINISHMLPKLLYKYRKDDDRSWDALKNCKIYFSNRNGFNDLLDSRLELVTPTIPELELLDLQNRITVFGQRSQFPQFVIKKKVTLAGQKILDTYRQMVENLLDSYQFYCLCAIGDSIAMWSYYADDHKGFCIEFNTTVIRGDQVQYKIGQPKIKLIDHLKNQNDQEIGKAVWEGLRTKELKWDHEEEYRLQPSNEMKKLHTKVNADTSFAIYQPEWVESIIFGYKMSEERRQFFIQNYPHKVKFKHFVRNGITLAVEDLPQV